MNDFTIPQVISTMDDVPQRRLSRIQGNDVGEENLAFNESPKSSRKCSVQSADRDDKNPQRKISAFHRRSKSFETDKAIGNGRDSCREKNLKNEDEKEPHSNGSLPSQKLSDAVHLNVYPDEHGTDCWYTFCFKCRKKEPHPSWQPSLWPIFCPYPFCPTYRQFSRLVSLGLIGVLLWCIMYSIVGETVAPPNGKIFQLIVLCLLSYIGGWLMALINMPGLIGMLFMGIFVQNIGLLNIDESFSQITKELRSIALVIILIRAGLDLDPTAFRKLKYTIVKIGLIPWFVEVGVDTVTCHYFLDLPWDYSILLNTVVAAVSPAVVVPSMFRLRTKGYGVAKGIPTLIIAIAGIDDAASVAFFGITKSIMFSSSSMTQLVLQGPISIIGGLGFGLLWGLICNYAPEKHDPFMVPIRILLLLTGGTVSIFGTELIGYGGAGPLACVGAAFACLVCWSRQGWDVEQNPANTAFEVFWMIFEPILFGITGTQIRFSEMDGTVVLTATGILVFGFTVRILATIVVGIGCKLNLKEKAFVAVSVMSKASVQAALGPVALGMVADKSSLEYVYGEKILMVCILSIILTAPAGALFITLVGPKLLTKTVPTEISSEWLRSHRPSIRDLGIIGEETPIEETNKTDEGLKVDVKCDDDSNDVHV